MAVHLFTEQQLHLKGIYGATVHVTEGFNPVVDAERLYKAMKGLGTNEKEIIAVLGHRISTERTQIAAAYYDKYHKSLKAMLLSETSGDFKDLLSILVEPLAYVDAFGCYRAMKGGGTRERQLNQVLLGKSNPEMAELESEYRQVLADHKQPSTRSLSGDLIAEASGGYENALVYLMDKKRDDLTPRQWEVAVTKGAKHVIEWPQVKSDARALYQATMGQVGVDAKTVMRVLLRNNQFNIQGVNQVFLEETGAELHTILGEELCGDFRNLCLDAVEIATEQPLYYARLLRNTMHGLGTNDHTLQRLVVARSEIDMQSIKECYQQEYKRTLTKDIIGDTTGDYKNLLLSLIGDN